MTTKTDRLHLRLDEEQRALLEAASAESHTSISGFVLSAATAAAQDVLADRRVFRLDNQQWAAFDEALKRPAQDVPGLRELLGAPSVLDDDA